VPFTSIKLENRAGRYDGPVVAIFWPMANVKALHFAILDNGFCLTWPARRLVPLVSQALLFILNVLGLEVDCNRRGIGYLRLSDRSHNVAEGMRRGVLKNQDGTLQPAQKLVLRLEMPVELVIPPWQRPSYSASFFRELILRRVLAGGSRNSVCCCRRQLRPRWSL
jgi:hypothetical protein